MLYPFPDHAYRDSPPVSHQEFPLHKISQRSKKYNLKSTIRPAEYTIEDPISKAAQPDLQVPEPDQDISTISAIPTIINGVIMEHTAASSNSSTDIINYIDSLLSAIKDQNKSTKPSNITRKLVLSGDSHIKGSAVALQSVLDSEYEILCCKTWF